MMSGADVTPDEGPPGEGKPGDQEGLLLFVDDEQYNCAIFAANFATKFRLKTVTSPLEALEVLKSEPVGVLVSDQRMPDMTGNELMAKAKQLYPETVRVIATAFDDPDPILKAVNDGLVARYVIKPWNLEDLERIIRWGFQAYAITRIHSALQFRLLQTERLATLGTMAASVMHDLNQPLSYLTENTRRLDELSVSVGRLGELVKANQASLSPGDASNLTDLASELPEIVSDMLTGCKEMTTITHQLRQFVRPSKIDEKQSCDPAPTIRYAVAACRELATRAHGRVIYEGREVLPRVRVGTVELSQVMVNLVGNAAQALSRRGRRGGRVQVTAEEDGAKGELVVRIADDGPGMSPETLARVGEPFFTTRAEGTGLGVLQCRRIVESAHGTLMLESEEGVGTTVTLRLPVE